MPLIQVKTLIIDETLGFHTNLAGEKAHVSYRLDKAIKKDFIENELKEDNYQSLTSRTADDKCTHLRKEISLSSSSIYKSVWLRQKLRS